MHQRVAELLHDEFVELGLFTRHRQPDILPVLSADLAHNAGERVEHLPDRDHADVEDTISQRVYLARHLTRLYPELPLLDGREPPVAAIETLATSP